MTAPTEHQRLVLNAAEHLVQQLQDRATPAEALAMLSIALQMTIMMTADNKAQALAAVDHISGELRVAVNQNFDRLMQRRNKANGHG